MTNRVVKECKSLNRDLCKFLFSPWTLGLSEDFLTNNDADYYLFKFELLQKECKSRQFALDLFKRVISNLEMKKKNSHEEAAFFLIGQILPHLERTIFVLGAGLSDVRGLLKGKGEVARLSRMRGRRSHLQEEVKARCMEIAGRLVADKSVRHSANSLSPLVADEYNRLAEIESWGADARKVKSETVRRKYLREFPFKLEK